MRLSRKVFFNDAFKLNMGMQIKTVLLKRKKMPFWGIKLEKMLLLQQRWFSPFDINVFDWAVFLLLSPLDENIADTPGEVGEAVVGHSSQEGAPLCGHTTSPPAVQPDAFLCFLQHVVQVQTHPGAQSDSLHDVLTTSCWTKRQQRAFCRVILPVDVVVDGDVVAVVIVVRLQRLNLTVSSSHHHVALVQKHLTHSLLHTHTHTATG